MPLKAKIYVYSVIAVAGSGMAASLPLWHSNHPLWYLVYLAVIVGTSAAKMRLPGITGAYSVTFLPLLYGLLHFDFGEVLASACLAGVAQSILHAKRRPLFVQIVFNAANVVLSVAVCSLLIKAFGPIGPAMFCGIAALYFFTNTVLVSGILTMLEGKPLGEVCEKWYLWSFAYYLLGAAAVGLTATARSAEPWLLLLPIVYLIHFYYGLSIRKVEAEQPSPGGVANPRCLSVPARALLYLVLGSGFTVLAWSLMNWSSRNLPRFGVFLLAATITATWKIRLPKMTGTLAVGFIFTLFATAEMTLAEVLSIAAATALVQSLWNARTRPKPYQVLFNVAAYVISATCSVGAGRLGAVTIGSGQLSVLLIVSTLALYLTNALLVTAMIGLAEGNPLAVLWRDCCFWCLPYYLVGTAVSGIMVLTSRRGEWLVSLMVMALMAMVYISYRANVRQAASAPAMAGL